MTATFLNFLLQIRSDITDSPAGKNLLVWGNGGWRVAYRDMAGNWRSLSGRPGSTPKIWAELPRLGNEK